MSRDQGTPNLRSTYDANQYQKQQELAMQQQMQERIKAITAQQERIDGTHRMNLTVHDIMDLVESTIHACGGEQRGTFLEVSRDFLKLHTRVPVEANLYPFLADGHNLQMRFHKKVTQMLLDVEAIKSVRWYPAEDRGAVLTVCMSL